MKAVLIALFSSLTVFAQSSDLKLQIEELASEIRREVRYSTSDRETLTQVRDQLRSTLDLLSNQSSGGYTRECFDFAYQKYYINMNSTQATDKAIQACRQVADFNILKFAYEKYYINMNSTQAMDKAVLASSQNLRGKMPIITFAYEKYYINMNSTQALDRAIEKAANVGRGALTCLQDLYPRYYQNMNSAQALDKAFEMCR